ncbi:MAG: hypothetical protein ACREVK_10950 [Gammaproteobacteria bacterium]
MQKKTLIQLFREEHTRTGSKTRAQEAALIRWRRNTAARLRYALERSNNGEQLLEAMDELYD